jgi:type IV secretory pathway component VirB8
MAEDYKKIAESIRSGKYFAEARGWFEAVYIGPVSERSFFLIIAVLAGLIFLFSFMSIMRLMPITKHEPILMQAGDRPDEVQASLVPLAPDHVAQNPAIVKFFLVEYVEMRESFDARTFLKNAKFVQSQSTPAAYNAYAGAYSPSNPQSPFAALGDLGQRLVTVETIRQIDVNPVKGEAPPPAGLGRAEVMFSTDTVGVSNPATSKWTATVDYIYTGLETKMVLNPETKQKDLEVTDPHFQVVNYVISPSAK